MNYPDLRADLSQRVRARPSVEAQPWGNRETTIHDPFGNRLTFWTPTPPP